jgi:hypothetical protein
MTDIPVLRLFLLLLSLYAAAFGGTKKTVNCLTLPVLNNSNNKRRIELKASPLIGGPSWLPLHCKVVVDDGAFVFDYVPKDPTSTDTIRKLILLQSVPAEARIRKAPPSRGVNTTDLPGGDHVSPGEICDGSADDWYVHRAVHFCRNYRKDLHLVTNNCWSFAFDLIRHVVVDADT